MTSRRRWAPIAASLQTLALVPAACGTDSGGSGGDSSSIQVWEGYTQTEAKVFAHLVSEYERTHPGQKVSALFVNSDNLLEKVLTAVRGGSPPDIARKLTDPAHKQYGTAYVTPGTEDTVWHWEALLWEAGGQLLTPDNSKAAFDSPAGPMSLNTLRSMAVTDKSMYLDPSDSAYSNL
jgi:ABC-type glycerol-3-phosphate transport system substrate-binding protein